MIPYEKLQAFEKVRIEYSGSNDEGFINDIVPEPEVEGVEIAYALRDQLERFAYDLLETNYGGWEINEGSHGHIEIDVKARKTTIHHGWTVETTEWEEKEVV